MAIWPTDDPTGTHASDAREGEPDDDVGPDDGFFGVEPCDDIDRADLDAATRADMWLDENDTDYDGPDWPF